MHADVACENNPAYIPKSKKELNSVFKVLNNSVPNGLPRKLRKA